MTAWNAYWFRPAPYFDLAVVRIVLVAVQLALMLAYPTYDLAHLRALSALPDDMYAPIPLMRLVYLPFGWDFRPSFTLLQIVHWSTIVAGAFALLGLRTNLALGVFTAGIVLLVGHAYSYHEFHHPEAPLVLAFVLLTLSPAGRVLALDARHARRGADATPVLALEGQDAGWPLRTIQWLFVLIYLSAVLSKLVFHDGLQWLNGHTLQYYMVREDMQRGSLLGGWFAQYHMLVLLSQYFVVIFQATFVLAVILPKLRWIYVPLGLGFHVGNIVFLNAVFYEWIALYAVFIPWRDALRLLQGWWRRAASSAPHPWGSRRLARPD